ncbi:MAG: metal-sensitive transcriptional regulator [Parvularcula sp.]|jgi:DNA-binding FrmR family transcriptional regulator|nr:metal-sensitive transcriptional regulator [Parvularcula sp.]
MKPETRKKANQRLARVEGQVRGIAKMVEADRYCIDVVRQIKAARAALGSLEAMILEDHLASCVDAALVSGDLDERRAKVEELVAVLGGKKR